jgi:hypothetical protein
MKRDYTRKEFLGLGLGLASLAVVGCGDDGAGSEETGGTSPTGPGTAGDDDGTPSTMTNADDGGVTSTGPGDSSGPGPGDSSGPGPGDSSGPGPGDSSSGPGPGDSSDSGSSSDGAAVSCANPDITIDLHMHTLTIPEEDVIAGKEVTYQMGGGHTHTLTLTSDDFAALAAGETIMVQSSNDVHMHTVTITCA